MFTECIVLNYQIKLLHYTASVRQISSMENSIEAQTTDAAKRTEQEKAPDSSENGVQKPRPNKSKKRKKPKDSTAPRHPLTGNYGDPSLFTVILLQCHVRFVGYVRYLNDRRETVRSANPSLPFAEITKILASEWSSLPTDKKQQYLDAAEQDRERYTREYNAYKQTEAYKLFTQQQNEKKMKDNKEEAKINVSSLVFHNVT